MENVKTDTVMPDCLTEDELLEMYDEMLDEIYGQVKIAGYEYNTSSVLKEIDPAAYNCGFADYIDSLVSDGEIVEINGEYYNTNDLNELEGE